MCCLFSEIKLEEILQTKIYNSNNAVLLHLTLVITGKINLEAHGAVSVDAK